MAALDLDLAEWMLVEPEPHEADDYLIWNLRKEAIEANIALTRAQLMTTSSSQEGAVYVDADGDYVDGYYLSDGEDYMRMAVCTRQKSRP